MIDNKNVITAIFEYLNQDLDEVLEFNKDIVKINSKIDSLLNAETLDKEDLSDAYMALVTSIKEMAYIQGLQDGTKLLHTLLSGNAVSKVMDTLGYKATDKLEINCLKFSK